jgi:hypothetical protein
LCVSDQHTCTRLMVTQDSKRHRVTATAALYASAIPVVIWTRLYRELHQLLLASVFKEADNIRQAKRHRLAVMKQLKMKMKSWLSRGGYTQQQCWLRGDTVNSCMECQHTYRSEIAYYFHFCTKRCMCPYCY